MAILYKANETDFNHLGLGPLNEAISVFVPQERNGVFELEMKYPVEGNQFNELKLDRLIKAGAGHKLKNQRFKIIRITKPMDGIVTVYAEHVSYLTQDLALKPDVNYSGNASVALNTWSNNVIDSHPFTVYSDITTTGSGKWSIKDLSNARQALGGIAGSILDTYGGEYEFDNYAIRLYANRGKQSDALIAYGRNLTELTQEETIESTYTSIYPYAVLNEDNKETILTLPEYFVDSEYVGNYARRKILKVDFSQEKITTVEELRTKTKAYIKANNIGIPSVNLKVKFIDLAKTLDYKNLQLVEQLDLCDWVTVYFEKFNIKTNAKVIKVVWDDLLEQYDSIEIGEARASLSDSIGTTIDGKLETVVKTINTIRLAADGKTTIYSGPDEPPPANVNDMWYKPVESGAVEMHRWNGIIWKLEKTSADSLAGQIDFSTVNAININADSISTGTITGANMFLNLDTGELLFYNPITGEILSLSQGRIEFQKDNQKRVLEYNAEGLKSLAGANNTGTSRNSSFHLEGSGTGSVQYLQSSAGNGIQQRLEFEDIIARILVGTNGSFEVKEYISDAFAPILASRFETRHASGARLILAGNSLSTPRDGNRDMFLAPNGNGSVVAGDADGLRWNMVASDFVKQSTRDSKTDINPLISKGMDVINRLSPVSYKKIDKLARGIDEVEIGFIAEDSLEVATEDGQGIYDSHITAYLVKAMQEKDNEIKSLKDDLNQIKEHLGLA